MKFAVNPCVDLTGCFTSRHLDEFKWTMRKVIANQEVISMMSLAVIREASQLEQPAVWKDIVRRHWSEHQFFPGCSVQQVEEACDRLSIQLPSELQELLHESNGVHGSFELGLVWPLERIVEDNALFRVHPDFGELYMSFESLLFFADAGNGDQFAFAINNGRVRKPDIYAWNHEDDSRVWVAPSLQQYIDWSACGKIKI